jgi:hypothetical protein
MKSVKPRIVQDDLSASAAMLKSNIVLSFILIHSTAHSSSAFSTRAFCDFTISILLVSYGIKPLIRPQLGIGQP